MGYDHYTFTLFLTLQSLQLSNLFLLLSFSTRKHISMAFRAILLSISLKNSQLKISRNTFRDMSCVRFPTTFLEIAVCQKLNLVKKADFCTKESCQYLTTTAILETEACSRYREVVLVVVIVSIVLTHDWVQTRIFASFLILIYLISPSFCHSVCFLCGVPLVTCYAMRSHCTSSCKLKYLRGCTFLVLKCPMQWTILCL